MSNFSEERADQAFREIKIIVFVFVVLPIVVLTLTVLARTESEENDSSYREPGFRDSARMELDSLPWRPIQGQTLYVPAYSHIFHQAGKPRFLTVTLSARNTDREKEIVLTSVRYIDTSGKEVKSLIQKPLRLGPLASTEFVIDQQDKSGGSGACFIVQWQAGDPVTHPVVESVMIDTSNSQGISFVRSATVLDEVLSSDSM